MWEQPCTGGHTAGVAVCIGLLCYYISCFNSKKLSFWQPIIAETLAHRIYVWNNFFDYIPQMATEQGSNYLPTLQMKELRPSHLQYKGKKCIPGWLGHHHRRYCLSWGLMGAVAGVGEDSWEFVGRSSLSLDSGVRVGVVPVRPSRRRSLQCCSRPAPGSKQLLWPRGLTSFPIPGCWWDQLGPG